MNTQHNKWSPLFPHNLLSAIIGKTALTPPKNITSDILAGILYVLSTLSSDDQSLVYLRYMEANTPADTACILNVTELSLNHSEAVVLKRLRSNARWPYIQYGISGYIKKVKSSAFNSGYVHGYRKGYNLGIADLKEGNAVQDSPEDLCNLPIEQLNLSARCVNSLRSAGCSYIYDVASMSSERIRVLRGIASVGAREIAQALRKNGILYSAWDEWL